MLRRSPAVLLLPLLAITAHSSAVAQQAADNSTPLELVAEWEVPLTHCYVAQRW